jgi:hypothetical protein
MQPTHASRRILLPVRNWFIVLTLFLALVLNLVPFGRFPGIPDWVALVLAFWCVHQPLKVGMAAGFVLGLAMDVADASVMGQHALAYVLLAFAAAGWSRRVLWFPLSQQALHVPADVPRHAAGDAGDAHGQRRRVSRRAVVPLQLHGDAALASGDLRAADAAVPAGRQRRAPADMNARGKLQ